MVMAPKKKKRIKHDFVQKIYEQSFPTVRPCTPMRIKDKGERKTMPDMTRTGSDRYCERTRRY